MKKPIVLVLLFFILFVFHAAAQDSTSAKSARLNREDRSLLETANGFYSDGNFIRALSIYRVLADNYPENAELQFKAGICFMYKVDEKSLGIDYLNRAAKLNPKLDDLNFYLGRAYHSNYRFQDAVPYFEAYLKENPPIIKKNLTEHYLDFCKNGEGLVSNQTSMIIENIGPPINTENSEYVPVLNADQSILIFTYKGEKSTGGLMDAQFNPSSDGQYYEDVFISYRVGERWTEPQSIGPNINTKGHDASIALSFDGQKLFIFKSTEQDKGDIYMSKLQGEVWGKPVRLGPTINTRFWEGSVSMSSDEQTLYFASERPGGFGGRDIYSSQKSSNGEWGPALNLGARINTEYDEDAPFIHPDNKTLFFSSKGHKSMGGYDIFSSVYRDSAWTEPENMGAPLNTPDDDLYYVLTPDGETGYYSSDRKEGYGQQDIYVVTPGLKGDKPILALTVGQIFFDNKPSEASIKLYNIENGDLKGDYKSNSATGKYIVALQPGLNFKLAIEVAGQAPHYEYINVKSLDTYVKLQKDIQMYSEKFMKENHIDSVSSFNLQKALDEQLEKYKLEINPDVYEARMYKDLLSNTGYLKKDSVSYNVELGAYETAGDCDINKFSGLGKVDTIKNANGSTTYHIAGFKTMDEAEAFRQKVIAKDSSFKTTAQLTVNDHGKDRRLQDYYKAYYGKKDYVIPTEARVIRSKVSPDAKEQKEMDELVSQFGDKKIEGLNYKLEIAAVDKESDFKLQRLAKYGKIEKTKYPDGKIRYTIGNFKTLKESDNFKKTLVQKEPEASKSIITVFYLNERKTVKDYFKDKQQPLASKYTPSETITPTPCETGKSYDFSAFSGKTLNDPAVYEQLLNLAGSMCIDGLTFKVQVAAYRHPENFKYGYLKSLGYAVERNDAVGDGITRFAMGEFKTLKDSEKLRQKALKLGTNGAWITAIYNGKRMTLEELIPLGFYSKGIN